MSYKIKETYISCDYCVDECPTACIAPGVKHLVIDNDMCVECGICVQVCPVDAVEGKSFEEIMKSKPSEEP